MLCVKCNSGTVFVFGYCSLLVWQPAKSKFPRLLDTRRPSELAKLV